MTTFVKTVFIEAPLEDVFRFHEREDALRLLSPPFPPVRVIQKTGGIEAGSRVLLQVGPFQWAALHTAYEKNRFFEDQQVSGPFAQWVHRHEFHQAGSGTRLTDRIRFELPGGAWINHLLGWAVSLGLRQMFHQRHGKTKRYCEKGHHEKTA
jgi:ligand-binding SRPBCC domain-containing protein